MLLISSLHKITNTLYASYYHNCAYEYLYCIRKELLGFLHPYTGTSDYSSYYSIDGWDVESFEFKWLKIYSRLV